MAPEQVRGGGVGSKADVYALGAVIFEALTGQRVVRPRETIAATLMAVINDPAPAVSSILPHAAGHVDALFNRALAKDQDERGDVEPWATELADALEQMPSDDPGWPEPIGGETRIRELTADLGRIADTMLAEPEGKAS
jgi:serine/threonine-protein kinase